MAPNSTAIGSKETFGDLVQRDVYVRDKYQTTTSNVNNLFYFSDSSGQTIIGGERVTYDSGTTESGVHLFSKTAGSSLDTSVSTNAMVSITKPVTYLRSDSVNIKGSATLQSSLDVSGATGITGKLTVGDATSLGATLTTTGAASFLSTLAAEGAATLGSSLDVSGTTLLRSTLTTTGAAAFSSTLTANGAALLKSTLTTWDAVSFRASLDVSGDTHIGSNFDVSGTTTLYSSLTSYGAATFLSSVDISGSANVKSTLTVADAATLQSTLTTTGAAQFLSTLNATGAVTTANTLDVSGATTLRSTLSTYDAVFLLSTLDVSGATNLRSTLTTAGAATLQSDVTLSGESSTLLVQGSTHLEKDLTVDGTVRFNNTLDVSGATTIYSTLDVWDTFTLHGDLDMSGNDILHVGSVTNGNNLGLTLDSGATSLKFNAGSTTSTLTVTSGGITVVGDLNVTGAMQQTIIQSNTVQVGDLNLNLGYQAPDLSSLSGGGFTLGDPSGNYTLPSLQYSSDASGYFYPNIEFRVKNGNTSYATLSPEGYLGIIKDTSTFTKLTEDTLNFSSKWRLRYDSSDNQMVMEYNDSGSWVTKFQFTT